MRKVFDFGIAAFIFLSALFYLPGMPFGASQDMIFRIGIPILYLLSLFLKPLRWKCNLWINLYVGLAFLSLLLGKPEAREMMIEPLVKVFMGATFFYLIVNYVQNFNWIYKSIGLVVFFNAGLVLLQVLNIDPICINRGNGMWNNHLVGFFGYPFCMGAYAAITTILFFGLRRWILTILSFLLVISSLSYISVGATLVGILICLTYRSRKAAIGLIIGILLLTGLFFMTHLHSVEMLPSKFSSRLPVYPHVLKIALASPYIGYGVGTYQYIVPAALPDGLIKDWCAHNDYLEQMVNLGVGVILILLGLIESTVQKFKDSKKSSEILGILGALITIAIGATLHSYMFQANVAVISLVIFGLFETKVKEEIE